MAFTLIELLIVVMIIAILASIVLLSLTGARQESKIKSNQAEARQLVPFLQQQYADTGSYSDLAVNSWIPGSHTCSSIPISGNYVTEYRRICDSVMNRLGAEATTFNWLVGDSTGTGLNFSIMIKTSNDAGTGGDWFCIGSSGRTYEGPYDLTAPGCYSNP